MHGGTWHAAAGALLLLLGGVVVELFRQGPAVFLLELLVCS